MHGGVQRNLTIWVTWQVSCKKQALITFFEHLCSSSVIVASLFSFLCFLVFCFALFVFVMCLMYPMLTVCLENWRHNQERTMQRHRKHWTHEKDEQSQKENKKKKKSTQMQTRTHTYTHTHKHKYFYASREEDWDSIDRFNSPHLVFGSSLPQVICSVLFTLFVCPTHIVLRFCFFFLSFWVPYVVNFSVLWILNCGRWLLVLLILVKLMTITVQNFFHYNTSTYRPATTICLHVTININGIWIIWKYCVDATSTISWNIATVQRIYCSELI